MHACAYCARITVVFYMHPEADSFERLSMRQIMGKEGVKVLPLKQQQTELVQCVEGAPAMHVTTAMLMLIHNSNIVDNKGAGRRTQIMKDIDLQGSRSFPPRSELG